MSDAEEEYPDWIVEQRGRRYRGGENARFRNKARLIRQYALHLQAEGRTPTFEAIRSMLRFLDRGYSLKADQISRALAPLYRSKSYPVHKAQNGWLVQIEGKAYPSARTASEAMGVSVQTVLRRIASARPEWSKWRRLAQ